jgi:hypothetical protein
MMIRSPQGFYGKAFWLLRLVIGLVPGPLQQRPLPIQTSWNKTKTTRTTHLAFFLRAGPVFAVCP